MGTFRKKCNNINKRTKKSGQISSHGFLYNAMGSGSRYHTQTVTTVNNLNPNDSKESAKVLFLGNNNTSTLEDNEDVSFLDILKKNNVSLFDASTPETKIDDLGISVKPISKQAQDLYYANSLFPLTIFYYENDKESRDYLGLNYSEMKNVSVNKLLTTSNIFQCTDISVENSNYNEENIKQQDKNPIVIGSNIFGETPQNVNLNNTNSLFNKVVYENSKTDSSLRQDFVRQERLKKFRQNAGAYIDDFKDLPNTTSLTNKINGLYWFFTQITTMTQTKIEQFINYYMFSQNYQRKKNIFTTYISQTQDDKVDGNSSSNISIVTDYKKIIMSLSTPTEIFFEMPNWIKARGVGLGSPFSFFSCISLGYLARNVVSEKGSTESRSISYNDLNLTNSEAMGERKFIVSIIDKKHLLYSIFFKIIVEIDDDNFDYLCSLLKINDYEILNVNRKKIKTRLNENIPYHLFMENLNLNKSNNKVTIQTVLNTNFVDMFIYFDSEAPAKIIVPPTLSAPPAPTRQYKDLKVNCEPIWNNYLAKLFFYFVNGTIEKYDVNTTYYTFDSEFSALNISPKICDIVIDKGIDKIMKYSYIDIAPPATLNPEDYSINDTNFEASRKSGYGNITDGKGKLWFYDTETGAVTDENKITTNFNDIQSWQNVGTVGTVFSTVNSRITHHRSNLLCYLSELIYSSNDVVKKVSDDMFQASEAANIDRSRIIYIGGYDNDPSYPYAFDSADNDKLKPSYSRIHVWLYINNNYNVDTTPIDNIPSLELFIVNRGSKTGLDWEDLDKCISEGTALYNERPMSYSRILYKILNDLDSKYENLIQYMKPSIVRGRNNLETYSRNIQIISSGHSLGGFLGLYFSFMSLSRNIIENFSSNTGKIKGNKNSISPPQWKVNKYILPIVFQPYVKTLSIIETFNKIPCGVINTVYDFRNSIKSKISSKFYIDAASDDFFYYIEKNKGDLKVCKYENVYLDDKISSMHASLYHGVSNTYSYYYNIAVNAHALWQMSGLCLKYYAEHVKTNFYIKANINGTLKNQNLEVTKYNFNFNNDCIEYGKTNDGEFTKTQAIDNIISNIQNFLDNPDTQIGLSEAKGKKKKSRKKKSRKKNQGN